MMKEFGSNIVPLECVGMLLNYVGNYILNDIHNNILKDKDEADKKVFYGGHKVIDIVILNSGDYLVTAVK